MRALPSRVASHVGAGGSGEGDGFPYPMVTDISTTMGDLSITLETKDKVISFIHGCESSPTSQYQFTPDAPRLRQPDILPPVPHARKSTTSESEVYSIDSSVAVLSQCLRTVLVLLSWETWRNSPPYCTTKTSKRLPRLYFYRPWIMYLTRHTLSMMISPLPTPELFGREDQRIISVRRFFDRSASRNCLC